MNRTKGFGTRYGRNMKKRYEATAMEKNYPCPSCKKMGVRRKSAGIWECIKCSLKFAGKAYRPS